MDEGECSILHVLNKNLHCATTTSTTTSIVSHRLDQYTIITNSMFNFHKLATYYITLVMTMIGGTFIRSPNLLLDAFGVLPFHEKQTLALEGMDPVYQLAYNLAFASHLVVGFLGLYSILLHSHSIKYRRMVLLSFGVHQAVFAWACRPMPAKWQEVHLLPVYVNVILVVLLLVVMPESKPELPSLKRRRQKVKSKSST